MNYLQKIVSIIQNAFTWRNRVQRRKIRRPLRFEALEVRVLHAGAFSDQGNAGIVGLQGASMSWGDYDNDGDQDVLVGGTAGSSIAEVYQNDGSGNFTSTNAGLAGISGGTVGWGDYDNDGKLDILLTGGPTVIYHNDGNGIFADAHAGLTNTVSSAAAWGDYDSDGMLDVIVAGSIGNGGTPTTTIYRNQGDGTFTDINAGLTGMANGSVAWGDYDNDGKLDVIVTGQSSSSNFTTKLYHNDSYGKFTEIDAGLVGVRDGSAAWGDSDNDGDLDLAISGMTAQGRTTRVYRNDGNGTFANIGAGLTGVRYGSVTWGDYDNDGRLDLFVSGEASNGGIGKVYHNDSGDTFTDINAGFTGAQFASSAWGDYDSDGDLDILYTGNNGAPVTKLYRNNASTANTAPSAPSTLAATTASIPGGIIQINRDAQAGRYIQSSFGATTSQIIFTDARATATLGAPAALGGQISVNLVNTASNLAASSIASVVIDSSGNYTVTINLKDNGTSSTATLADIQAAVAAHAGAAYLVSVSATAAGGYGAANTSAVFGSSGGPKQLTGGQDTTNNDLTFTDIRRVAIRDDFNVAVALNASVANQPLGISVATDTFGNKTVNVSLATDSQGRVTTTTAQLKSFFDSDVSAGARAARTLLSVAYSGDGSGTLAAAAAQSLPAVTHIGSPITLAWQAATDLETPSAGLSYNLRVGTSPGGSDVFSTMANTANGKRTVSHAGPIQGTSFTLMNLTAGTTYYWSVQAVDSGLKGGAFATEQAFHIYAPPMITAQDFLIGENSVNGAFIGMMVATDVDAGQTKSWSITSGNPNNAFAINPATGVLTVNNSAALDYETRTQISLAITATDNGSPALSETTFTTVYLRNENESPIVTPTQFLIGENSLDGAFIGSVPITDQDSGQTHTYSIVAGNGDGVFAINQTTGVLTVHNSASLDYETVQRFDLVVRVVDSGSPAQAGAAPVTVFLRDMNDPPVVSPTQFLIGENSRNGAFIGTIPVTDADSVQTWTYSIIAGNYGDAFTINSTTGVLSVNNTAALDYETVQRFDLVVRVVDNGSPAQAGAALVTVFLRNENDAPMLFAQDFLISENSQNAAFIGTMVARDQDVGQSKTFAITSGNTSNAFSINTATGVISVNNSSALNYEAATQFNLMVSVTDNGNPALAGSAPVVVYLRNVNEDPVITPTQFLIGENSVNGAFIGAIPASDEDTSQVLSYAIAGGNVNNAFSIDATSGVLYVNNSTALDYELVRQFELTVRVTDNGNPSRYGTAPVTVYLRDTPNSRPESALKTETSVVILPTVKRSRANALSQLAKTS